MTTLDLEQRRIELAKLDTILEQARDNLRTTANRLFEAFTDEEKSFIRGRLKNMEANYQSLEEKREALKHNGHGKQKLDNIFKSGEKYPGLKYDVDDPEVRKRIGKDLSYDSGFNGYTENEAKELLDLIDSVNVPKNKKITKKKLLELRQRTYV